MSQARCSHPPELSEDQLYAVIDGVEDAQTVEHLAACAYCLTRMKALQRFDAALESRLVRFECLSAQTLMLYQLNDLDTKTRGEIAQHVKDCPRCQQELDMLDPFVSDRSGEAESGSPGHRIVSVPRHLWRASYVEISGNLALKGMQGSNNEHSYDIRAGNASVFLEVHSLANSLILTGQVIDEQVDWRGAIAEIHQAGSAQRVQILDDLCEFRFDLTETSLIDLYISAPDGTVLTLEQLKLSTS